MAAVVSDAILQEVLNYMDITWKDPAYERKVKSMILAGMSYIDEKRGSPANYEEPGLPHTLLLEFVRYMRDGALDVFEQNYLSLILSMQNRKRVTDYATQTPVPPGE